MLKVIHTAIVPFVMQASSSITFSACPRCRGMKNHKIQRTLKLTNWFLDLEDGVALEKKDGMSKLVKETLLSTLANHLLENQNAACLSIDFESKPGEAHGRPNKK
jgi:hypothetical protein